MLPSPGLVLPSTSAAIYAELRGDMHVSARLEQFVRPEAAPLRGGDRSPPL